jgi:hypothetical protein
MSTRLQVTCAVYDAFRWLAAAAVAMLVYAEIAAGSEVSARRATVLRLESVN